MKILFEHLKKYPKMEITDAVKLLYQREFGGGHLIKDREACIEYLKNEFSSAKGNNELIEDLGNGMCRVYLAAAKREKIDCLKIADAFISSANEIKGDVSNFEKTLTVVMGLVIVIILDLIINFITYKLINRKNLHITYKKMISISLIVTIVIFIYLKIIV